MVAAAQAALRGKQVKILYSPAAVKSECLTITQSASAVSDLFTEDGRMGFVVVQTFAFVEVCFLLEEERW